jgi:hypothetical protein
VGARHEARRIQRARRVGAGAHEKSSAEHLTRYVQQPYGVGMNDAIKTKVTAPKLTEAQYEVLSDAEIEDRIYGTFLAGREQSDIARYLSLLDYLSPLDGKADQYLLTDAGRAALKAGAR